MAVLTDVKGRNKTNVDAEPSVKLDVSEHRGRVRRLYDEYVVDAADEFGLNSIIRMSTIPANSRLMDARAVIPDAGSTGVVDVGWAASAQGGEAADPNGIFSGLDPASAAVDAKMAGTIAGYNKKFTEEVEAQMLWTTASDDFAGGSGGTIKLELLVAID